MPFQHLEDAEITKIYDAALKLGLANARVTLLGDIDPGFVGGLPSGNTPVAQLLSDLQTMNGIAHLDDPRKSVPLRRWLSNAVKLTSIHTASRELKSALAKLEARDDMPPAEQHGEVLRPSGNGRRIWAGAGLLLLVGLGGGYALYRGGGSGAGGGLDGGPATSAATVTAPPVSIAPVVPPPINSSVLSVNPRPPGTLALAPSQPGTRPPDSTPTAASVRPDAPPAPMRGTATLTGSFWSLGVPANAFGSAGYVCLDPSPRPAELMGVQPTCGLAGGAGTALCSRSDKARAISIGTSVPWRSPCP